MKTRFSPATSITPFDSALKYLLIRQRSNKEVFDYLTKKGYTENEINQTIKRLIDLNFLNEDTFTKSFIESKQRKGKSKRVIEFELKLKGVSKDQSERVLENAPSDIKTAYEYINKRFKQFERFPIDVKRKKIISRLRSRGYNWDTISKVLKKLIKI